MQFQRALRFVLGTIWETFTGASVACFFSFLFSSPPSRRTLCVKDKLVVKVACQESLIFKKNKKNNEYFDKIQRKRRKKPVIHSMNTYENRKSPPILPSIIPSSLTLSKHSSRSRPTRGRKRDEKGKTVKKKETEKKSSNKREEKKRLNGDGQHCRQLFPLSLTSKPSLFHLPKSFSLSLSFVSFPPLPLGYTCTSS